MRTLKGKWAIMTFKWGKSKSRWVSLSLIAISLVLAWNGGHGYVPAEFCWFYTYLTYGLTIIGMLIYLMELYFIDWKYKEELNIIRRNYGFRLKN